MGERIFEGRICNKRKCEGTLMMGDRAVRGEEQEEEKKKRRRNLEGIAVLAWLPSGSVSGHFIHPASSTCLGLFGTGKDGSLPTHLLHHHHHLQNQVHWESNCGCLGFFSFSLVFGGQHLILTPQSHNHLLQRYHVRENAAEAKITGC
jgi:hypothetical protein